MSSGAPTYDGKSQLVQDRFIVGSLTADGANITTLGAAVYVSIDWAVKTTDGSNRNIFGVALTKANSGDKISLVTRGIVYGTAAGSISANDMLYAGTGTGRFATATAEQHYSAAVPYRALAISSAAGAGSGVYLVLW